MSVITLKIGRSAGFIDPYASPPLVFIRQFRILPWTKYSSIIICCNILAPFYFCCRAYKNAQVKRVEKRTYILTIRGSLILVVDYISLAQLIVDILTAAIDDRVHKWLRDFVSSPASESLYKNTKLHFLPSSKYTCTTGRESLYLAMVPFDQWESKYIKCADIKAEFKYLHS